MNRNQNSPDHDSPDRQMPSDAPSQAAKSHPSEQELPPVIDPLGPPKPVHQAAVAPWVPMVIGGGLLLAGGCFLVAAPVCGSTRSCRIQWSQRQAEIDRSEQTEWPTSERPQDE